MKLALATLALAIGLGGCASIGSGSADDKKALKTGERRLRSIQGNARKAIEAMDKTVNANATSATAKVDANVLSAFRATTDYCAAKVEFYESVLDVYNKSHTTVGAYGALVTVLGAVTVNPVGKTVLTSIGIQSTSDHSVLGIVAAHSQDEARAMKAKLDKLRTQFLERSQRFVTIDAKTDLGGYSRDTAVQQLYGGCSGLDQPGDSSSDDDPPAPAAGGASAPGA